MTFQDATGKPPQDEEPLRKIIQIAVNTIGNGGVLALCDDGTLWNGTPLTNQWAQVDTSVVDNSPVVAPAGPIPIG